MVLNFFDTDNIMSGLAQHFSIDLARFNHTIKAADSVHKSAFDIAKVLNLDLLSDTHNCNLVCRHITTSNDSLQSIMSLGLLRLDQMLALKTPLSSFLKRYGIVVDPQGKNITLKDFQITINEYNEPCSVYKHTPEQTSLFSVYNHGDLHDRMAVLHTKLYHDKGEVECYISGEDITMLNSYTSITNGPEILMTIGQIINAKWKKTDQFFLQDAWSKQQGMRRYILEFEVPLDSIETNTNRKTKEKYHDDSDWYDYAGFSSDDYFDGLIPLEFYRNKRLLEVGVKSLFYTNHNEYCQILPPFIITPDKISIHKEYSLEECF